VEARDEIIPFSFNGIIRDVLDLYRERFERAGIRVNLELASELPVVDGHPDQLQEVIVNVVQNALEAMSGGGELTVSTGELAAPSRIYAEVIDTGTGISPEHLPLLFEPGFTTKVVDGRQSGFGWGLFTVRQIVGAHGGEIEITSQPARTDNNAAHGTTVKIFLPTAKADEVKT
jgi:signal transduction histidine kinase